MTITCLFANVPIATEQTRYTLYFACGYQNKYSAKTFNYYTIELFKPVNCFTNINQHGKDNFLLKVNSKDNTNIQSELSAIVIYPIGALELNKTLPLGIIFALDF